MVRGVKKDIIYLIVEFFHGFIYITYISSLYSKKKL